VTFGWIPAVLLLFAVFPPRRAVIITIIVGWLFLPFDTYKIPLLPDYTKMSGISFGLLLAIVLFDFQRLVRFRFSWIDVPVALFCISPLPSSVANGLGVYNGVSGVIDYAVAWGLPYFIGRMYFWDAKGIRELAIAIFIGGLIYIPFCLFEVRMSPQLAAIVYGQQGAWNSVYRFGGYRPIVFMYDGLLTGLWMAVCALVGYWLLRTRALTKLHGISLTLLAPVLLVTAVLCRSTGAIVLLFVGIAVLEFSRFAKTRVAFWCLLLVAPLYLVTRITGMWSGGEITELAAKVDAARAHSFQFRIKNEDMLVAKALQRPAFGWGGYGRGEVHNRYGDIVSVPDGLWVQTISKNGLVGLVSLYAMLLTPVFRCIYSYPRADNFAESVVASLAVATTLFAIDCLPNAMENPIYPLVLGGLGGLVFVPANKLTMHVRSRPSVVSKALWPREDKPRQL